MNDGGNPAERGPGQEADLSPGNGRDSSRVNNARTDMWGLPIRNSGGPGGNGRGAGQRRNDGSGGGAKRRHTPQGGVVGSERGAELPSVEGSGGDAVKSKRKKKAEAAVTPQLLLSGKIANK